MAFVERMRVRLAVALKGRTATFSGGVVPARPGEVVLIEQQRGTRFVTLAKAKLTRKSTFKLSKKLARGSYVFRAETRNDRNYFGGVSATRPVKVK